MSSRGTDEGSGRKSPAEKEAFAMAIWWEAIKGSAHWCLGDLEMRRVSSHAQSLGSAGDYESYRT